MPKLTLESMCISAHIRKRRAGKGTAETKKDSKERNSRDQKRQQGSEKRKTKKDSSKKGSGSLDSITKDIIFLENDRILNLLSMYLNDAPNSITAEDIASILEFGISEEEAFSYALAGLFGLEIADNPADKAFYQAYFPNMVHKLEKEDFLKDPYFSNIVLPQTKRRKSAFEMQHFEAYEGFVCDDMVRTKEGRIIAQIGFFNERFDYPAVLENDRIWMSLAPNEINSQKEVISACYGNVITFGLGLGYFAYMAALKHEVEEVSVVEINPEIIELFNKFIAPQIPVSTAEKIEIIQDDAFSFARDKLPKMNADFAYVDLWHDVGDGVDLYLKMKKLEGLSPNTRFSYWIEQTMLCYL